MTIFRRKQWYHRSTSRVTVADGKSAGCVRCSLGQSEALSGGRLSLEAPDEGRVADWAPWSRHQPAPALTPWGGAGHGSLTRLVVVWLRAVLEGLVYEGLVEGILWASRGVLGALPLSAHASTLKT